MTSDSLLDALSDPTLALPLLASLIAGGLIGAEREFQRKSAGLRTHALLCFGATLLTLLGLRMEDWTAFLPEGAQIVSDMARLPHAILTGVGFLGAGVIFREGASVHGLTTAATLWVTAGLGVVFGTGMIELAILGTLGVLIVLIGLRLAQRLAPHPSQLLIDLTTRADTPLTSTSLERILTAQGLQIAHVSYREDGIGGAEPKRHYQILAQKRGARFDLEAIAASLRSEPAVMSLSLQPEDFDFAS